MDFFIEFSVRSSNLNEFASAGVGNVTICMQVCFGQRGIFAWSSNDLFLHIYANYPRDYCIRAKKIYNECGEEKKEEMVKKASNAEYAD